MSLPLTFKNSELEEQWDTDKRRHPMLVSITDDFCETVYEERGWLPKMTSFIRSQEEDDALGGSGIHTTGRANDMRTKGIPKESVDWAVSYLNGKYVYDPARPALPVAYAKPHGNAPHLHLQVCDATKLRAQFQTKATNG